MTYLAGRPEGQVCALRDVSSAQDVPESFLAKIFQSLVRADLVVSYRGARGGFALARPADQITMAQIICAIDGPISLNKCVLWPETCSRSGTCLVHEAWMRAEEAMLGVLDTVTCADLVPAEAEVAQGGPEQALVCSGRRVAAGGRDCCQSS